MGTGAIVANISWILLASANDGQAPLSALVWWLIPLVAFIGAVAYVIWVSKFKTKYENETNRSVDRFRKFQDSFDQDQRGA
jgi:nitric oxide reductase large subunit